MALLCLVVYFLGDFFMFLFIFSTRLPCDVIKYRKRDDDKLSGKISSIMSHFSSGEKRRREKENFNRSTIRHIYLYVEFDPIF